MFSTLPGSYGTNGPAHTSLVEFPTVWTELEGVEIGVFRVRQGGKLKGEKKKTKEEIEDNHDVTKPLSVDREREREREGGVCLFAALLCCLGNAQRCPIFLVFTHWLLLPPHTPYIREEGKQGKGKGSDVWDREREGR